MLFIYRAGGASLAATNNIHFQFQSSQKEETRQEFTITMLKFRQRALYKHMSLSKLYLTMWLA